MNKHNWVPLLAVLTLTQGCGGWTQRDHEIEKRMFGWIPSEAEVDALIANVPDYSVRRGTSDIYEGRGPGVPYTRFGVTEVEPASHYESAIVAEHDNASVEEGHRCVARLISWAIDEVGGDFEDHLLAWMQDACGSVGYNTQWYVTTDPRTLPLRNFDEIERAHWVFVGTGRYSPQSEAVTVVSYTDVYIEPVDRFDFDGRIVFSGDMAPGVDGIVARLRWGRFGVLDCTRDWEVRPPRFRFDCAAPAGTDTYGLEVSASREDSRWYRSRGGFVWDPDRNGVPWYARPDWNDIVGEEPDEQLARSFTTETLARAVNEVRVEADLSPVRLHAAQSEVSQALFPHWLNSIQTRSDSEERLTVVSNALESGWEIDGVVTGTQFIGRSRTENVGAADFVALMLDESYAREVLLNPGASELAIGADVLEKGGHRGATFTFFDVHEVGDIDARFEAWLDLTNSIRSEFGRENLRSANSRANAEVRRAAEAAHNGSSVDRAERGLVARFRNASPGRFYYGVRYGGLLSDLISISMLFNADRAAATMTIRYSDTGHHAYYLLYFIAY